MPQLSLRLLGAQVVAVVQVLVLAQIRGDLANLRVELHVDVALLAEHYSVLKPPTGNVNIETMAQLQGASCQHRLLCGVDSILP